MGSKKGKAGKVISILIAEDSPTQALQLQHTLEKKGFAVTAARNGKEALSLMKKSRPAVVISDIIMPEMDGYELCHHIKKDPNLGDIPVILLTQLSDPQDIIKGLQAGANNFVTKPYDESFLLSRIQYVLINQEVRKEGASEASLNICFMGKTSSITSDRMQIIDLLLSTYEHAVLQNQELKRIHTELETLNKQLEDKVEQRTQKIENLNSLLRAIRGVNQLIVREKDRDRLITEVCKILTAARGYHNAWIALIDESGELLTSAEAGLGKEFLPLQRLLKGGKLVNCAQRALKKSGVIFIKDPFTACADCPLAKELHTRGAMAVRLEHGGKTFGLLSISIPKDLVRNKEGLSLFEEVAGDISFGLYNIEMEEERKQGEEALQERTYELGERVKELSCLYNIARLIEKEDTPLEEILQGAVNLIPAAFEYPEIVCARIILGDKEFRTENFREAPWKLTQDITVHAKSIGILEVSYLEQRPERDEGPFMKEEIALFEVIAERLGHLTERLRAEENLRHERDFISRIMETSPVCITMVNHEGKIIFANPGAEEVLGLSPDEVTGRTYNSPEWRITDYDGKPFPEEQLPFRRVMDTGLPVYDVRHAIEWPDGRRVLLSANGAPLFDNADKIEGVICTIQDLTEQIRASKALGESEQRYRTLFEQSRDPIYINTREGAFLDVNQAFLELFGYTREEIKSLKAEELYMNPNDRTRFKQQVEKAGFVKDFEVKFRKKDGTEIDCLMASTILKAEDGSIVGYHGIVKDITERKRAEEALKDEVTRRRILVEQSRDGIVILDQNGKVYEANQQYADTLGYSMEEVLQLHAWDWDTQFPREQLLEMLRTVDDTGDFFETRHRRKDGTFYDVEISTNGAAYGGQKLIFCICRDITERKQAEAKIKEYAENLEKMVDERTNELHLAKDEAEAANHAKSDFLASMSHELRTPLNAIIGFSEVLRDQYFGKLNKKQAEYATDVLESGKHLLSLINDVLDLSKIEAGKVALQLSEVSIKELLKNSLIMVKERCMQHGINLKENIPQDVAGLEIVADERAIKQVMFNLLSNAVKFTPDNGSVRVEANLISDFDEYLSRQDTKTQRELKNSQSSIDNLQSSILISVADTGIGITPEDQKKIFDEFYQVKGRLTDKTPGTGLGLSLSRRLIEMHKGRIWVESKGEGKGSRFSFMLPIGIDD